MEQFIATLTIDEYRAFARRCIGECNVSRAAWSYWRRGLATPIAKYRQTINRIALEMFGRTVFATGAAEEGGGR